MAGYTYDITTSGEPGTLTRNNDNAIKNGYNLKYLEKSGLTIIKEYKNTIHI